MINTPTQSNSTRMSTAQRTARAIQRASEQRAHVLAIPGRPGFFRVRSATDAAERYVVSAQSGVVECSCKAAEHGAPCWHRAAVESRLIRAARAVKREPVAVSAKQRAIELLY